MSLPLREQAVGFLTLSNVVRGQADFILCSKQMASKINQRRFPGSKLETPTPYATTIDRMHSESPPIFEADIYKPIF